MDPQILLSQARQAGLTLVVQDERLVVRGPKALAPLVQELFEREPQAVPLDQREFGVVPRAE